MERVRYTQKTRIKVPRYELYIPKGEFPNERFSLGEAKGVLERWNVREPTNNCWGDPWTSEMTEIYRAVKETRHDDRFKAELINRIIAENVQHQFSKAIMGAIREDCDLIAKVYYPAFGIHFMIEKSSRGIIKLEEPPLISMTYRRDPVLDFGIEATKEVNLEGLTRKINDYLSVNWTLPNNNLSQSEPAHGRAGS